MSYVVTPVFKYIIRVIGIFIEKSMLMLTYLSNYFIKTIYLSIYPKSYIENVYDGIDSFI